jgi:tRNA C32,U32 (ribose-2'-O)-methylase TrmJ
LKDEGYHILCTDVNPESKDIRDVDWDASGKKICIIMGNEQYGVSDQVKALADESFYLPMVGMAESFNLSVATAITCAHLSAASIGQEPVVEAVDGDNHQPTTITSTPKGPLRAGDLSEHECKTLLLKGALNTVKHKVAQALFRQHGLEFPKDFNLS